jgi:hypothetical protein
MRKQCIVVAGAAIIVFLSVFGAAAQGPRAQAQRKQHRAQTLRAPTIQSSG